MVCTEPIACCDQIAILHAREARHRGDSTQGRLCLVEPIDGPIGRLLHKTPPRRQPGFRWLLTLSSVAFSAHLQSACRMARAHPSRLTGRTHEARDKGGGSPCRNNNPRHLPSFKPVEVTLGRLGRTVTLPSRIRIAAEVNSPLPTVVCIRRHIPQSSRHPGNSYCYRTSRRYDFGNMTLKSGSSVSGNSLSATAPAGAGRRRTRYPLDTDMPVLDEQGDRQGEAQTQTCGATRQPATKLRCRPSTPSNRGRRSGRSARANCAAGITLLVANCASTPWRVHARFSPRAHSQTRAVWPPHSRMQPAFVRWLARQHQ